MKELYDKYILAFSGGKDCTAAFLHLLESGVPKEKIELWHHEIDGREGPALMDWDCTPGYCKAFAKAFDVPIYFSWKEGGFEREMLRQNSRTAPTKFESEDGSIRTIGGVAGKLSTRRKFPQVSGDLKVRWCSAYLKIDVCAAAIRNQMRFEGLRVCVVSGERAEESAQRAKYAEKELDRADNRDGKAGRFVDRLRPVKHWTEQMVWDIIAIWRVRVHPCYYLGFGRCSCLFCIFGNENQTASAYVVAPHRGERIISYEKEFGYTIKRNISMGDLISQGTIYEAMTEELLIIARSKEYSLNIFMDDWVLPAGAFGESCGPN